MARRIFFFLAFLASCTASAAAAADKDHPCLSVFSKVQSCIDSTTDVDTDEATSSCMLAADKELNLCMEQGSEVLRACSEQGIPLRQCLMSAGVSAAGAQAVLQGIGDSECGQAIQQAAKSAEGTEALLASGRVALAFATMAELIVQLNQTQAIPPFLIFGHIQSIGDADACRSIPGFQYCWLTPSFLPTAKAGLCVPNVCSVDDLTAAVNPIIQSIANATNTTLPEIDLSSINGQCGDYRFSATPGTYIMLVVTFLLVLLVATGTWMDHQKKVQREYEKRIHDGYSRMGGGDEEHDYHQNGAEVPLLKEEKKGQVQDLENPKGNGVADTDQRSRKQPVSLSVHLLECFSLYRTLPTLLAPARPGDFNTLDGIRTFSMSWVVLGHILVFPLMELGYTNEDAILPPEGVLATYAGQAIIAAEFAVDTFFTIGSFLASYLLLQYVSKALRPPAGVEKKEIGWKWLPMLYVHRWLRLTPTYFYVLLMYWQVMRVVQSGPFWGLLNVDYQACEQYWWTNLLYINTLVPWNGGTMLCYAVSWYMSVDFQLFLFLPFLVLIYVYHRPSGYLVPSLLWLASTAYAFWLVYGKGESVFIMSMDIMNPNGYQTDYYFKMWARAPVYLLGILFAFLWNDFKLATTRGRPAPSASAPKAPKPVTLSVILGFSVSFILLGLTVYGAKPAYSGEGITPFLDHCYTALSRSAWTVGLLLLCFLMFQGYGPIVIALLDNRVMAVLSRLTFCAYLIHPALIDLVFASQTLPNHYSTIWLSFNFVGMLTCVFLFSFVVHLLVEKPLANVEGLLLKAGSSKKGN